MEFIFETSKAQAGGATTFAFKPPQDFGWVAGQSIKIEVQGAYGPLEHRFSISAAPAEGRVAITTRLSGSPYKNALARLQPGDKVKAYGLEGDFVWRESDLPLVFVAGGIGITPYHSILKQRVLTSKPIPAKLIYGSATDDIIFKDELDVWQKDHPEFSVEYVVGKQLDASRIAKLKARLIYLSGPSAMVDELSAALIAQGVPEGQLVRDWFTGRLPEQG